MVAVGVAVGVGVSLGSAVAVYVGVGLGGSGEGVSVGAGGVNVTVGGSGVTTAWVAPGSAVTAGAALTHPVAAKTNKQDRKKIRFCMFSRRWKPGRQRVPGSNRYWWL
jgi:hypothetical protein